MRCAGIGLGEPSVWMAANKRVSERRCLSQARTGCTNIEVTVRLHARRGDQSEKRELRPPMLTYLTVVALYGSWLRGAKIREGGRERGVRGIPTQGTVHHDVTFPLVGMPSWVRSSRTNPLPPYVHATHTHTFPFSLNTRYC